MPSKQWLLSGLKRMLKKSMRRSIERLKGTGRPLLVRFDDNIERIEQLGVSQEDTPGIY